MSIIFKFKGIYTRYRLIYNLALWLYNMMIRLVDFLFYTLSPIYYLLIFDMKAEKRVFTVGSIWRYSMVGRAGLFATYDIVKEVEEARMSGGIVECGVARGGCAALMALVSREYGNGRPIWLFDSFEGLPEPTEKDEYVDPLRYKPKNKKADMIARGYCLGTIEEVNYLLFNRLGLEKENIHIVKGWFQETLPKKCEKIGEIAVLRIDGDWYESTKCCLDNLYDNVIPGGYVIIDDYNSSIGCRRATREFLKQRDLNVYLKFDSRGGCYFNKPRIKHVVTK